MSGEKTEQPTAKRLRDAREKGQVAKSQEVPSAAVVMMVVAYFLVRGGDIMAVFMEITEGVFLSIRGRTFEEAWPLALSLAGAGFLNILGPLIPLVIAASLISNLAQVGILFNIKSALPKMENLSPSKWFKKTFSKGNIVELLKNVTKVAVLTAVVWRILNQHWRDLFIIPRGDILTMTAVIGSTLKDLVVTSAVAFSVMAVIDFAYQHFKYIKDNMMTRDEVKREYKEMEGDPLIKSKRKQLHQEMSSQNTVGRVRQAKVLVTNPTHYAVALDYEEGRTPLPVILAKGEGELARRMIETARQAGVPILREAQLARSLYEEGLENAFIPKDLIEPVAEVLRWVRNLKK